VVQPKNSQNGKHILRHLSRATRYWISRIEKVFLKLLAVGGGYGGRWPVILCQTSELQSLLRLDPVRHAVSSRRRLLSAIRVARDWA
jgi:hypothetical protein